MSERDELAAILNDWCELEIGAADAILAAGYRKAEWTPKIGDSWNDPDTGKLLKAVPDDCVVVRRDDAAFIRKHWWAKERELHDPSCEVQDRLIAALADQSGGTDHE